MYLAKIVYNVANFTRPSCISGHENSKLCDKNVSFPKKKGGGEHGKQSRLCELILQKYLSYKQLLG